jgi:hypothetical protein
LVLNKKSYFCRNKNIILNLNSITSALFPNQNSGMEFCAENIPAGQPWGLSAFLYLKFNFK